MSSPDPDSDGATARRSDPVSRALLPILLHEVNNATQLLVGLRALLGIPGGEEMFAQRADDLARTSRTMDDLGFALAVIATAGGANMLMARRLDRGLEILWSLAVRSIQRDGQGTVTGEPPRIAPRALDGWQVPWAGAALVIAGQYQVNTWRWESSGHLLGDAEIERDALRAIAERVPGSELHATAGETRWSLPAAWIRTTSD